MRRLVTSLVAIAILVVAYATTFGIPAQVTAALPFSVQSDDAGSANTTRNAARAPRSTAVVLQPLEVRPYTATIQTIGTATSWRSSNITAEAAGRVTEVLLNANTEVEAGDILVRLDDRSALLTLAVAQAEYDQAKSVVDRYEQLLATGRSTITDVAKTEAELDLTLATNSVGLAEVALEERTIRAPISGRLGLNTLEIGDLVAQSEVIVTVDDTSSLLVEFELPERAISLLSLGQTVLASTPTYAGRVFEAEITAFDSRIDSTTRSISVQARIDNSDALLWSGMTFAVRLLDTSEPLAMVPATALNWARHGAGIWVVDDGKAARHPVTVRFRRGDNVWIDTDVAEGATVVTEGGLKLRNGSIVESVPGILNDDTPLQGIAAPTSEVTQ